MVEGTGIALIAFGASTSNVLPVFAGIALYSVGRDTSDRLVQKELRKKDSELEKNIEQADSH